MRKGQGIRFGRCGKRITALAAAALLCVPANMKVFAAPADPGLPVDEYDAGNGYVSMESESVKSIHDGSRMRFFMASPEQATSYRTPNLPPVRSQKGYDTCWAFAPVACMETYLLNHGVEDVDLSELHLAYFANHSVVDPLGGTEGDSYSATGDWLASGGNYEMVENTWADWVGAVEETVVPYSQVDAVWLAGLEDELAYSNAVYHLQGYRRISMSDTADVKKAIVDYGALAISYYSDITGSTVSSSPNYNALTHAYYCSSSQAINHGVAIVGWDDSYSKTNFNKSPGNDGAWIVRNSWGESFGESGYFYLSYEDQSLDSAAVAFIPESADHYTHNYQYDGAFWKGSANVSKPTNIFTASGSDAEYIQAVSFETYSVNVDYTVRIYLNPADPVNPESGTLKAVASGSTDYQGMYTVPLSEPLYVEQGDVFAVMVELTTGGSTATILVDKNSTSHPGTNAGGVGHSVAVGEVGWYDYGKTMNTNFHIKAYTTDANPENRIAVSGISLSHSQTTLKAGENLQLQAEVTPENAYNTNIRWSSSNPAVAAVSSTGLVTAVAGGSAVITATAADGGCTASCQVDVTVPLQGIGLNHGSVAMRVGETTKLTVSYTPNETTDDTTIQWSSSDPEVASVDAGTVTGLAAGKATITASCGTFFATSQITVNEVKVSRIRISNAPWQMTVGDTVQLGAELTPANATNQSVTWSSSDSSVLSVDTSGKLVANKAGAAVIRVTAASSGISDTMSIEVLEKANTNVQPTDTGTNEAGIPKPTAEIFQQTGWVQKDGTWYYYNADGVLQTGWVNVGGIWYYMNESGAMQTGWVQVNGTWYYIGIGGAMQSGWVQVNGTWYYMNESGAMQTGWVQINGTWYYMNESGAMQTGWIQVNGVWYYTGIGGTMLTGWQMVNGRWYYLSSDGSMQTGWLRAANHWYYLGTGGAMQIGWYTINGKWYYSYASGVMAANTRIGNYRFNANGEWVR
ncbi:MAG: Ig-like domain-containing protein [Lachnospiraceae bacterium]|nr:Ig-like domain-containing protein [Lachnospiraceae bacterium]